MLQANRNNTEAMIFVFRFAIGQFFVKVVNLQKVGTHNGCMTSAWSRKLLIMIIQSTLLVFAPAIRSRKLRITFVCFFKEKPNSGYSKLSGR